MIKSLLVIDNNGEPVYTFITSESKDFIMEDLAHLVTALRIFGENMVPGAEGGIRAVTLKDSICTFRTITLHSYKGQPLRYCFAIVSPMTKDEMGLKNTLEYFIVSFLNWNSGRLGRELRNNTPNRENLKAFDKFISQNIGLEWADLKKKAPPPPATMTIAILNALKDYLPLEQIHSLNQKIFRIGPSYIWLSDDLTKEEEGELYEKIRQALSRLYGDGLFDSIVAQVRKSIDKD